MLLAWQALAVQWYSWAVYWFGWKYKLWLCCILVGSMGSATISSSLEGQRIDVWHLISWVGSNFDGTLYLDPQFVNRKLLLRIDNQELVFIINKRTSKSKFVMKLVRPMVLLLMSKNIQVRDLHIPGVNNVIAESLSRFQLQRFRDWHLQQIKLHQTFLWSSSR